MVRAAPEADPWTLARWRSFRMANPPEIARAPKRDTPGCAGYTTSVVSDRWQAATRDDSLSGDIGSLQFWMSKSEKLLCAAFVADGRRWPDMIKYGAYLQQVAARR